MTASGKRIVITGASGVGKTTLEELLAPSLGLSVIPEIARVICGERGLKSPAEVPDQQAFRNDVLQRQVETEKSLGSFISDRSTIDCWVMWQRWHLCSAMTYDSESYYEKCRKQAETYTHIIYVPLMFQPPEDSFRWTEPDYLKQLDRLTRLTLYDWSLLDRTYTICSDNQSERLAEVSRWLGSVG